MFHSFINNFPYNSIFCVTSKAAQTHSAQQTAKKYGELLHDFNRFQHKKKILNLNFTQQNIDLKHDLS